MLLRKFTDNILSHTFQRSRRIFFYKGQLFLTFLHGATFGRFYNETFNSNITVSYLSNISTLISPPRLAFSGLEKRPLILPIMSMPPNNQCKEEST